MSTVGSTLRALMRRVAGLEARRDPEAERLARIDAILSAIDEALEADAAREKHRLDHEGLGIIRRGIASWKNLSNG